MKIEDFDDISFVVILVVDAARRLKNFPGMGPVLGNTRREYFVVMKMNALDF